MKAIPLELTRDVVSSYDQTKTTVLGRAAKKTLSGIQGGKVVVGTPLNGWADSTSDAAVTPARVCVSDNGHELQFVASTATGVVIVALYDVNETTGVRTYVGKISVQLSNTTHTVRGVRLVNDSGATGWRILINTIGTIVANGGLFSVENIAKVDFAPVIPTVIPVATATGQKAVYWHQETGGTNLLTVSQGFGIEQDGGLAGQKIVVANGLVAAAQFYTFDAANPIVTVGALGVTTDWYSHKTGVIPGLTGTFLLLNNYSICVPSADSMAPVALQGQTCLFVPGSTGFGLGKISDLTSGATSWPSYAVADIENVSDTSVAQTPATAHFSQTLQRIVYQHAAGRWVVKKFVNDLFELEFGSSSNPQYRTGQLSVVPFIDFGALTVTSTYEHAGWLYYVSATVGQIGSGNFDLRSLWQYDHSAVISKVIDVPRSSFVGLSVLAPVRSFGKFWYRTSGFGSATGGWIAGPDDRDFQAIPNLTGQIQFKIQPRMERESVTTPLQVIESHFLVLSNDENHPSWRGDFRYSVSSSPAKTAFSQVDDYTGSKHWEFFAYRRDTGALVAQSNTQDNPLDFELSTNDGASFGAIAGAIASAKLLNVIRYKWSSPPGFEVDCSLREKV